MELTITAGRARVEAMERVRAYATLTKPGITAFITITAAGGFLMATGGGADPLLFLHVLLATALTSAGAAGLNQVREADADARMRRTERRPLPGGTLTRAQAAGFGVGLSVTGLVYSAIMLPWATTLLLALSHASYVVAYTPLKRITPLCTLVGAIPGSLPILAGWTATGAALHPVALALAGILYTWQIPHFLAIAWICRDDYGRAGFRVLSVVDPDGGATGRISLLYALALVPISLVPWFAGVSGATYAAGALLLGAYYVLRAGAFARERSARGARRLFLASLVHLPVLLGIMVADRMW